MTEEYASFKQIEFMKKLGFPPQSADLTKQRAREMIDEKLREGEQEFASKGYIKPEHKHPPAQQLGTTKKESNGKEYHLSPEEVKCRALESAIEFCGVRGEEESQNFRMVLTIADKFAEWIYK